MADQSIRGGTIPGLDGVRAVAFLIVFLSHVLGHKHVAQVFPGRFGVTVFFFLSGFLICTLMRMEHARTGRVDFADFFARRALRLLPPFYLALSLMAGAWWLGWLPGRIEPMPLLAHLTHWGNYYIAWHGLDSVPEGTTPFWSLAIEQQFYLVFPLLFLLLAQRVRADLRVPVLIGLCGLILARRVWVWVDSHDELYLRHATDTRLDVLLAGCALAMSAWNPWLRRVPSTMAGRVLSGGEQAITLACLAGLAATLMLARPWWRETIGYSVQCALLAPLFWLLIQRSSTRWFAWLSHGLLARVGAISYMLYLVHDMVLIALVTRFPHIPLWALGSAGLLISLAIAETTRRSVEQPLARWRHARRGARQATPMAPATAAQGPDVTGETPTRRLA